MVRKPVVAAVVVSVVLAGCTGTPFAGTPTPETPADETTRLDVAEIPGIANGTITDAAALAGANGAAVVDDGARLRVSRTLADAPAPTRYTYARGADGSFRITTTTTDRPTTLTYYSNDTATYVRTQRGDETRYQRTTRSPRPLGALNDSVEAYLDAGAFSVVAESVGDETVTLTAERFGSLPDTVPLSGADSLSGRVVVTETGQLRNLTVTGDRDGERVAFRYDLAESGIDHVGPPAWMADFPATAGLQANVSVDVVDGSYVTIAHTGGDTVPAEATFTVSMDEESATATLQRPLEAGDTRYAYVTDHGGLTVTATPPAASERAPLESPLSVTLVTADGVTVTSAGIAWSSASASGETTSSSER